MPQPQNLPEQIDEMILDRIERMLVTFDRTSIRIWMDGYKKALEDRGLITDAPASPPPPVAKMAPENPTPLPTTQTFGSQQPPEPEPASLYEIPTDALPQGWRKVYHRRGEYPCGKAALLIVRAVYADERGSLDLLRQINGSKITPTDPSICGSCRKPIHAVSNADLEWEPHRLPPRQNYSLSFSEQSATAQTEPGTDASPNKASDGMDPAETSLRHPSSVLAEMVGGALNTPFIEEPVVAPMSQSELEEVETLYDEIGLPRPNLYSNDQDYAAEH